MVLHKSLKTQAADNLASSATILGLKVVGGTRLPNGRYGAVVEKVKKGSVADTVGHLLPGMDTFSLVHFLVSFDSVPRVSLNDLGYACILDVF